MTSSGRSSRGTSSHEVWPPGLGLARVGRELTSRQWQTSRPSGAGGPSQLTGPEPESPPRRFSDSLPLGDPENKSRPGRPKAPPFFFFLLKQMVLS